MRTLLGLVAAVGVGGVAHADTPRATPTPLPAGIALGVEVGEPTSATVRWAASGGRIGAGAAVGSGTLAGLGLALRAEVTFAIATLHRSRTLAVPVHVGLGVRHYRHGYDPASIDEIDDAHTGVFAALAVSMARSGNLEVYLEAAPGYDLHRTAACNLMSGTDSLCPHAQSTRVFAQVMIGARWYLGR